MKARHAGDCTRCGWRILPGMGIRRTGGGTARHANCELARYQIEHPHLSLDAAFDGWCSSIDDPIDRRDHNQVPGIPAAGDVTTSSARGTTRAPAYTTQQASRIIAKGRTRPRTANDWSNQRQGR